MNHKLMMMTVRCAVAGALLGSICAVGGCAKSGEESNDEGSRQPAEGEEPGAAATPAAMTPEQRGGLLDRTMTALDGSERDLSAYKGKVVLIVNTASRCGMTPQYEGLQALYESKADDGLVILGFPANDFRGQEPLSDAEIATFCTENYGVTFPMFSKISVLGADQHPLYAELSSASEAPSWNFTKYLLDREGRLVQRFDPRTAPQDPALLTRIDELLASG